MDARGILGLRASDGAKFWFDVCTELKNGGVEDELMAVPQLERKNCGDPHASDL